MKKTVSVNIKGQNFLIEEDGYDLLSNYINKLKARLANEKGGEEIIDDIEYRIAELFFQSLSENKQVVEYQTVVSVLKTLGDPADFIEEEEEGPKNFAHQESNGHFRDKRMFRDKDNAVIAGVASGLSNYFNVDVFIIRLIFVLFLLLGGFAIPLYIILWIVVPPATNSIEKLKMQGKPITVESVRDEVEQAAGRFADKSEKFAYKMKNSPEVKKRFSAVGRFFSIAIGIFTLMFGLIFLFTFIALLTGIGLTLPVHDPSGTVGLPTAFNLLFENSSDHNLAYIGLFTLIFSVALFCIVLAIRLLFRFSNKWLRYSLIGLVFTATIGFFVCLTLGIKTASEYRTDAAVEETVGNFSSKTFYVNTVYPEHTITQNSAVKVKLDNDDYYAFLLKNDRLTSNDIDVEFKKSNDSLLHVYFVKEASGNTNQKALKRAQNIKHSYQLSGDSISINWNYSFPVKDKLRGQEVKYIFEVPNNMTINWNGKTIKPVFTEERNSFFDINGYISHDGEYEEWED
ncbi:MAG: PspC domain-containing protein [Bacteroidota bacterium]